MSVVTDRLPGRFCEGSIQIGRGRVQVRTTIDTIHRIAGFKTRDSGER